MKEIYRIIMVASLTIVALSVFFIFWGDNLSRENISEDAKLLENLVARVSALEARNEHILTQADKRVPNVNAVDNKPNHFNEELISRVEKIEHFIAQIERIKNRNLGSHEIDNVMQLENDQSMDTLQEAVQKVMAKMFDERFQMQQGPPKNKDQPFDDSSGNANKISDYVVSQVEEKLALSKQQNVDFKELVDAYSDQQVNVKSQYHREALDNMSDPQEIEEYLNSVLSEGEELNSAFEGEFSAMLDPRQEEIYRNLPADVKAVIRENGAHASYQQ